MINKIKTIYTLFSGYGFPILIAILIMKLNLSSTGTISKDGFYQILMYTFAGAFGIAIAGALRNYIDTLKNK